ncbi:MAG: hypothetical protein ABIG45_08125, partial [Bacillota bacterium]
MKKSFCRSIATALVICMALAAGVMPAIAETTQTAITFTESNVELALRNALGNEADPIYPSDFDKLAILDFSEMEITDISFLQYFAGLQKLNLKTNTISDLSPLQNLSGLVQMDLTGNQI